MQCVTWIDGPLGYGPSHARVDRPVVIYPEPGVKPTTPCLHVLYQLSYRGGQFYLRFVPMYHSELTVL